MATIAEVAEDTFRINLEIPGAPIDVSFFVIRDERPTLVETGFRGALPTPTRRSPASSTRPRCGMWSCPTWRATSAAR